jgi:hypothetical protein
MSTAYGRTFDEPGITKSGHVRPRFDILTASVPAHRESIPTDLRGDGKFMSAFIAKDDPPRPQTPPEIPRLAPRTTTPRRR